MPLRALQPWSVPDSALALGAVALKHSGSKYIKSCISDSVWPWDSQCKHKRL
jgi:hypothetical protein